MFNFSNASIQRKFTLGNILASAFILFITCLAFIIYDYAAFRKGMVQNFSSLAAITAENTSSAIIFDDPSSAEDTLKSLELQPNIVGAYVYEPSGKLFARYARKGEKDYKDYSHSGLKTKSYRFKKNYLEISSPIILDNEKIGKIIIVSDLYKLNSIVRQSIIIVLIILLVSLIISGLISFYISRPISQPIHQLTAMAKKIAKGELAQNIDIKAKDEIGDLADSFNTMTTNLQKRDEEISSVNQKLKENEQQLKASNQQLRENEQQLKATIDELAERSQDLVVARVKAEQSLKEVQNIQLALNEHSIVAITDQKGTITYANDKFCKISEYSRKELIGQDHRIINSGYHPKEFIQDMWRTIACGKVWKGEFKNRKKNGDFYWVDTSIIPFLNKEGTPFQYIAIRTDITERKDMEEDLIEKKTSAEELSKKAQAAAKAKSDFLANMSHEIRTPMNSILGFSDLLNKTQLTDKQKNFLNIISTSGELLLGIIDDILDISKLESGKIQLEKLDFNLEDLIVGVFKMVTSRIKEKPFDTYIDIKEAVPVNIKSDPTRLKQILVNLLGNAVKFTSRGSIGVIVELEPQVDQNKNNCYLRFTVKDTGLGIPQDKKDTIFKSFTQADGSTTRKFGGTGLGLAISKALVSAFKGKIWAESEEGKGSEFIFSICVKKRPDEIQTKRENLLEHKKIFIVDDNQIARKIINKYCVSMGLGVIGIADSPQAALHKLDKIVSSKGIIPELILCDIMMEGMDGYELVRKIKRNSVFKNTKYLAVTADLKSETSKESTEELFDAYVTKPVNTKELVQAIKKVLCIKEGKKEKEREREKEENFAGIKVLVVEDAEPNKMLIQAYFAQLGCEGDYASNGQEAIKKLKKKNDYHLCLMDLQMPVMGGIEATKIIRRDICKDLPIIALTATVMRKDQDNTKEAGMTDFLTKPIDIIKLKEKILQYGRKKT